jgi:hypothetical protein
MAQKNKDIYYVPEGSPVYPKLFDKRVVARHLTQGLITHKQYEDYLKSLPDDIDSSEELSYGSIVNSDGNTAITGREMKGGTTH